MEKQLRVDVEKFVGNPLAVEGRWAGPFARQPADEEDQARRGRLFAVVQIAASPGFDSALAGNLVFDGLSDRYFRRGGGPPLPALEGAVSNARHRLLALLSSPEGATAAGGVDLNLAAAVIWGQILYLAQLGRSRVWLRRGGQTRLIADGSGGESVTVSSGMLHDGDEIILATEGVEADAVEKLSEPGQTALRLKVGLREVPAEEEVVQFVEAPHPPRVRVAARLREAFARAARRLRRQDIYLPAPPPLRPRRDSARFLILFLVLLLLVSVTFTIRKRRAVMRAEETEKVLQLSQRNLASARQLIDLNNLRARNLLLEVQEELERVARFKLRGDEVSAAQSEIRQTLDRVDKISRPQPEAVYDLSVQGDVSPTDLVCQKSVCFVADPRTSSVWKLDFSASAVTAERVAGGRIDGPRLLALFEGRLYSLGQKGVFALKLSDAALKEENLALDGSPGDYQDLDIYLGNLYLLAPKKNQVYKFAAAAKGFSKPIEWVKETLDLSAAMAMAIDGNIYILKSDGSLLKLAGGSREEFRLKNLDEGLAGVGDVFVASGSSLIYLLDSRNHRVVVVDKDGMYKAQYVFGEGAGEPLRFFVDEAGKKIFLLTGSKLFSFGL